MNAINFEKKNDDIAWCPGCGNFKILSALIAALTELGLDPRKCVVSSGIGQAPKTPHYFNVNMFNGLHGRALSVATAITMANPNLTVIAEGGDGDMYGEGGNHFLHNIRRNPNLTHIVHNNMVYGLTKGQASPTSQIGFVTPVQVDGVTSEPVNPVAVAIAQNASFVARAFCGDEAQTKETIKQAILHKGYALVDILQPCVSFNKVNTFKWFKDHTRYIDKSHDPGDRTSAFALATLQDVFMLGVLYIKPKAVFHSYLAPYKNSLEPLYKRSVDRKKLQEILDSKTS